ncbi:ABC transporter substrate-binding protein [Chelativorans salis]|uniref:ABC transporter substrate-binding protein n=1 Tax=Chelativorans salis TaxID=2978478 RepID=A0ABT2LGS8_9HYPH|nr:ABC transporter substrate-binding protein [Chelativorans sp. EGI FJ00035]MCT7373487.1 ABC transporter substrate-binding protein [Chelativorans sp. EGI FJ00035]
MRKTTTALAVIMAVGAGSASAADLRMSWWGGDSRHVATQEALKACGEKHGHTIKPEFTGWTGHQEKVATQLAGGTEADIMQINWPWLPLFSLEGDGFADLNEYSDTIDLSQWSQAQLDSATVNGKLNGLPVSTTGRVFFFNKATFEEAGLPLPATWDELIEAAAVFKEKLGPDYYPFDAQGGNDGLGAILNVSLVTTQMTGKDLVDPATNTVAWTAEELQKGIEFNQNLADKGGIRDWKTVAGGGNVDLFELPAWSEGKIAGSYEWDSTYGKFNDPIENGELVPVGLLTVEDAVTEGVYRKPSMLFSISKNSENPEAAAQIVNCLLNESEGIEALGDTRGIPASRIAAETLAEGGAINPRLLEAHKLVIEAEGPTVSPFNEHPEVREIFKDALEEFAYGNISAADAATEIVDGVNGVLAKF